MRRSPLNSELPEGGNRRRWHTASKASKPAKVAPGSSSPSARRSAAGEARAAWAVGGFLLLAVLLVFGQTARHEFVNYDDHEYVYENPVVARGLTAEGIGWAATTTHGSLWAPLTWCSYLLDSQLYGLRPGGYHFTNILLHAATTIVLFLVLRRMTGDLWPAAFVAAAFAVHPQHVESVAWVAERKGLLSGLFFMLTMAAYLGYVRRPTRVRYWGVVLLFALGLMAKPMLVTLPFVLLLLDYWPLGRIKGGLQFVPDVGWAERSEPHRNRENPQWWCSQKLDPPFTLKQLVVEKIPLFILAAASCAMTPLTQGEAVAGLEAMPLWPRIANALVSYAAYVGQFFYPADLAVRYPHLGTGLPIWQAGVALLALTGVTLAALACWRRRPYVLVGWLWYVGMLVPVSGLVQVGSHARADRYTYLPEIGLCLVLAWGTADILRSWSGRRWILGVATVLFLAVMVGCAWRQTAFWRNSGTLWRHAITCTSRNEVAYSNLGSVMADMGRIDEAIGEYREALKINPDYADVLNNLGNALAGSGRLDEAIAHYRQALKIKPDFAEAHYNCGNALLGSGRVDEAIAHYRDALKIKPNYAEAHYNLGNLLLGKGRIDEAIGHYRKALIIKPNYAEAHSNLGCVLAGQGRVDEAIGHYRQALKIKPNYAEAHENFGSGLAAEGRFDEAVEHYQQALKIKPNLGGALNGLAWLRATAPKASLRNGPEAIELAQRALRSASAEQASILDTLAAAYAEAGRWPEAVATARKALELAKKKQNQQPLAKAIGARLRLYELGQPYREMSNP